MPRLDCNRAFALGEGFSGGAIRVKTRTLLRNSVEIGLGEAPVPDGLTFVHAEGIRAFDLIGTGYAVITIVSEHFLDVLRRCAATGWRSVLVRIELKDARELNGYSWLIVDGRSGPVDDRLSVAGEPEPWLKGMCFDPDSWDGSDLFVPRDTAAICMVERVRDQLVASGVSNVRLTRLADVERLRATPSGDEARLH